MNNEFDEQLKRNTVQWLRDGNEVAVATLLERCDITLVYVDTGFELYGERSSDIFDVELFCTRRDVAKLAADKGKMQNQIIEALRFVGGPDIAIRQLNLQGKILPQKSPVDSSARIQLEHFGSPEILDVWEKTLVRRVNDPEGAITASRTVLEMVCKHILDEVGIEYSSRADLPKLYRLLAENLNLAPEQHPEQAFKQILGGCQSIVNGLATLRNQLGDAHGTGKKTVKPAPRHAELAVNLAGTMAVYLVATLEARQNLE